MATYKVFYTATFEQKLEKTEKSFQEKIEKIANQLTDNPFVGKPLGVKWFREKKLGKYRVYYLIYEDMKSAYFVNLGDKKNQQKIINSILLLLNIYKKEMEQLHGKKKG